MSLHRTLPFTPTTSTLLDCTTTVLYGSVHATLSYLPPFVPCFYFLKAQLAFSCTRLIRRLERLPSRPKYKQEEKERLFCIGNFSMFEKRTTSPSSSLFSSLLPFHCALHSLSHSLTSLHPILFFFFLVALGETTKQNAISLYFFLIFFVFSNFNFLLLAIFFCCRC